MSPTANGSAVERIYVRAPNWVGDFVMATAAFGRLRRAHPQARITVAGRPFLQPLCEGAPWCDEFWPTAKAGSPRGLWRLVQQVRGGRFDLAVILPNSLETALVPFLARVPRRLGYLQGRSPLLTHGIAAVPLRRFWQRRLGPRRVPVPMPNYYRDLLDVLRLPGDDIHPELLPTATARRLAAERLDALGLAAGEPFALLVVGANFGASKLWPPERFAGLARSLAGKGLRPLITVGPAEVELGKQIAAQGQATALVDPVLPLDQLLALVERCAVMVTGDTGPRHLAVACDRPVVCLMGPTDRRYTDYCLERTELIQRQLACVPCQRKVCPLGHHECMRGISVEEVEAAVWRLLAEG